MHLRVDAKTGGVDPELQVRGPFPSPVPCRPPTFSWAHWKNRQPHPPQASLGLSPEPCCKAVAGFAAFQKTPS